MQLIFNLYSLNSFSMKRKNVAAEHKKFFQINGFISFEELVQPSEMAEVFAYFQKHRSQLPGLFQENLFRSSPLILNVAKNVGYIAAALLDRKPVRIAYDCLVEDPEEVVAIEEREIGLLLSAMGKGFFFTEREQLYNVQKECYLLLIFTANYANNPIVYS